MTEEEFRTGKGGAFEASKQAAKAIFEGEAPAFDYISEAALTLSPGWHGDKVAIAQFKGRINGAIDAANKLDQVKKTLFYGRDNNLIAEGQPHSMGIIECLGMDSDRAANIIHAVIGKFTEAGELLEALRACYNGDEFDANNRNLSVEREILETSGYAEDLPIVGNNGELSEDAKERLSR